MEILVLADSKLSMEERKEIDAVCDQAFGVNPGEEEDSIYTWVMQNDWHVVVKLDGVFVSQVGIVERTGTVAGQPVKLGGVGGVATFPNLQKQGLASAAMQKAARFMQEFAQSGLWPVVVRERDKTVLPQSGLAGGHRTADV